MSAGSDTVVIADLIVAFSALRETLRTRVVLTGDHSAITVSYVGGPLKNLNSGWKFRGISDQESEVEFAAEFAFRSKILETLFGWHFDRAMQSVVSAFERRAAELYGSQD